MKITLPPARNDGATNAWRRNLHHGSSTWLNDQEPERPFVPCECRRGGRRGNTHTNQTSLPRRRDDVIASTVGDADFVMPRSSPGLYQNSRRYQEREIYGTDARANTNLGPIQTPLQNERRHRNHQDLLTASSLAHFTSSVDAMIASMQDHHPLPRDEDEQAHIRRQNALLRLHISLGHCSRGSAVPDYDDCSDTVLGTNGA